MQKLMKQFRRAARASHQVGFGSRVANVWDKAEILSAVRAEIAAELAKVSSSQRDAQAGATHEEARPENSKDTRALEASYLARGLARRVAELGEAAAALKAVSLRDFGADEGIGLAALVEVDDDERGAIVYFMLPAAGGVKLQIGGRALQVVSPVSPLGRALLGRRAGEEARLDTPRGPRHLEILSVR